MAFDWDGHRKHREYMIRETGQWAGVLDENGVPLCDLPPVVEMEGETARGDVGELTLTAQVRTPSGVVHPVVDALVAADLGKVDSEGKLVPSSDPTRFICIERAGVRMAYRVMFTEATGGMVEPSQVKVHAVGILDVLQGIPAWSNPRSITGEFRTLNQDFAVMWETPRQVAGVSMATRADGYTVHGEATTQIKRLIDESMVAVMRITGEKDAPVVCEILPGGQSPEVFIRPEDDSLWEAIVPVASAAGVEITGTMWLPGDEQPAGLSLSLPTVLVQLRQQDRE